jgi:hypothetical protein
MLLYPPLYQFNTQVWLRELANTLGRPANLADIPDGFLDQVDYVWLAPILPRPTSAAHLLRSRATPCTGISAGRRTS